MLDAAGNPLPSARYAGESLCGASQRKKEKEKRKKKKGKSINQPQSSVNLALGLASDRMVLGGECVLYMR